MLCFNLHLNTEYADDIKVLQTLLNDNDVISIEIINDGVMLTVRFIMKVHKNKEKQAHQFKKECEELIIENKRLEKLLTKSENSLELLKRERVCLYKIGRIK